VGSIPGRVLAGIPMPSRSLSVDFPTRQLSTAVQAQAYDEEREDIRIYATEPLAPQLADRISLLDLDDQEDQAIRQHAQPNGGRHFSPVLHRNKWISHVQTDQGCLRRPACLPNRARPIKVRESAENHP